MPINYNNKINRILENFRDIFIQIVFEELIYKGILSQFTLNKSLTDNKEFSSNSSIKKKKN